MGNTYYSVSVSVTHVIDDKEKKVKELYLVNALSVTEAEAKINIIFKNSPIEFEVLGASKTKYLEVVE